MSSMEKLCMVCGDKALGYNFNAVTCESCKAFFRRNALSSKDFTCPFRESCEITVVTRRFCQRCRLRKCFKIGMRKEYIMSEEDKLMKRKKIEQNRAKRKFKIINNDSSDDSIINKSRKESESQSINDPYWQDNMLDQMDSSPYSTNSNNSESNLTYSSLIPSKSALSPISTSLAQYSAQILQQSSPSPSTSLSTPFSTTNTNEVSTASLQCQLNSTQITNVISSTTNTTITATTLNFSQRFEYPNKDSNANDIVNFFLNNPTESSNYINALMPNQKAAMEVVTKIIHSQRDAMRMIGHLIGTPGDALKIISKIMNSPYDALTVFTKFMGSPTDALEIIAKCVNSPSDVLQFIQQLMSTPSNAVEIVNKFLNSPAEAMKMLNDMVNTTMVDSTTKAENVDLTNLNTPNDTVTDTMFYAKNVSSPMVRNLLESTHGDTINNFRNDKMNLASMENASNEEDEEEQQHQHQHHECQEQQLENVEMTATRSNTLEYIINDAINIEFNAREINTNRELNDSETAKLNELIVAYKALFVPLDEDITPLVNNRNEHSSKTEKNPQDPKLLTLINLTAIAIKRLIKMVKKINAFKNMCQEDQVALLKGGCIEMMILRSIMQYDVDHSIWNIPHSQDVMSSIKSDILKLANNNVYDEYENFIRTFDARLRKDENIILIMSAIVLFTPSRKKTLHTDVLILEQNSYYYLLRRYLESTYPGCEAKSLFLKLIHKIKELECLKDVIIAVYLDVNPNQVEPLLREIFDIKNC